MSKWLINHWPILTIIILNIHISALYIITSIHNNQGHFTYALDDAYIHMSMAKNLAFYHTWGITPHQFTPVSSSLSWTLLLAGITLIFGSHEITPLLLNIILSISILFIAYYILKQFYLPAILIFVTLVLVTLLTPLSTMTITGMEHLLHGNLTLITAYLATTMLSENKRDWRVLAITPWLTTTRLEGLFLIISIVLLLIVRQQWRWASYLLLLGLLPWGLFGLISWGYGWLMLPTSILLKTTAAPEYNSSFKIYPLIIALVILSLTWWYLKQKTTINLWHNMLVFNILLTLSLLFHGQLARIGWFYRYEAYLIPFYLVGITIALHYLVKIRYFEKIQWRQFYQYIMLTLIISLSSTFLTYRAVLALQNTLYAPTNIYQQQYQIAKFIHTFYNHEAVALNDIGAVSYFSESSITDLWGLANLTVAALKLKGTYNTMAMDKITQQDNIKIAFVFDNWLNDYGGVPPGWVKVGEWTIPNNRVCANETVSIYAMNDKQVTPLVINLRRFSTELPPEVTQTGLYLTNPLN